MSQSKEELIKSAREKGWTGSGFSSPSKIRYWLKQFDSIIFVAREVGYSGPEKFKDVSTFIRREANKAGIPISYDYYKLIKELHKRLNTWAISFKDNDKFKITKMTAKFKKNGEESQSREKPHQLLNRLWKTFFNEIRNHIHEKGWNIRQKFVISAQAKTILRNNNNEEEMEDTIKGHYSQRGYSSYKLTWQKITDITDDKKIFKEFVEPKIADWKYRDEKLVDGYAWTLISCSQIDLTVIPSTEVDNVEGENEDYEIGDEYVVEYPSWMRNSQSGVKIEIHSNGKNCFFMSVLYAYSGKKYLSKKDIDTYSKLFNWDGIDLNGTVTREQIIQWNKNNPNYYLVIYLFNGLAEETPKQEFLDKHEMYMPPPLDVEGKTPIFLLLLGSNEHSLNIVVNNATSVTSYVSNEIKKYFKRAHILPITNICHLFRGLDSDNQVFFCKKCCYHCYSENALAEHQNRGCDREFKPDESVSDLPIVFNQFGKLGRLPFFIVYDTETIQKRVASGPIQYKEGEGGTFFPITNSIPVTDNNVQTEHEAFLFPVLLWTQEEYTQFLPDSFFVNEGASIHDLERLGSISFRLPFGGLWLFYGKDCIEKGVNLLCDIDKTFVKTLKYSGKRRNPETGKWIQTTPIIMTPEDSNCSRTSRRMLSLW